ncbi:MAG TPA: hypothetical protein VFQ35_16765, partial [Polyangiaceae bacterium]|nr:hypothetical protein [Polyangiaceae bacterium]
MTAALAAAGSAYADPNLTPSERAQQLFDAGRVALKEHRLEEACADLTESARLDAAAGTWLNLAACREAQGR